MTPIRFQSSITKYKSSRTFVLMHVCHDSDQVPELNHQVQVLKASAVSHDAAVTANDQGW